MSALPLKVRQPGEANTGYEGKVKKTTGVWCDCCGRTTCRASMSAKGHKQTSARAFRMSAFCRLADILSVGIDVC